MGVDECLTTQQNQQTQDGFTNPFIVNGSIGGLIDQWDDSGPGSCFIEGTTMQTDRGDRRIETIGEGAMVLTRLKSNHMEWG